MNNSCKDVLTNIQQKNQKDQKDQSILPPESSIIEHFGFNYKCIDFYHEYAERCSIEEGEPIEVSGAFVIDYDKSAPNYIYVRAVFRYDDRWYYIPSTFSEIGTIDPSSEWKIIDNNVNYSISYLDKNICKKVCPGYLD